MGTASGDETLLWEPSEELKQQATLTRYMQWLEREKGLYVRDQEELWHWSVSHLEDFWASIWDFFSVKASRPYTSVLADRKMPGAQWFPEGLSSIMLSRSSETLLLVILLCSSNPSGTRFVPSRGRNCRATWVRWPMRCEPLG